MNRQGTDLRPAMLAALALHLLVLFGGLLVWPNKHPLLQTGVTTVTLVNAPSADLRPAEAAEEPAPAAAETPAADAALEPPSPAPSPEPPAPAPPPKPAPPKPAPTKPAPAPVPTPAPAKTPPAKAAPKPAAPSFDLDALTSSLSKAAKAGGARSSAPKGPNRAETATTARQGAGVADTALADASALVGERLNRMWNPNCSVEGAGSIIVRVKFNLTPEGELAGPPQLLDQGTGAVWQTAADRAVRAVAQAAPYKELPRANYAQWKVFVARFNGEQACRGR